MAVLGDLERKNFSSPNHGGRHLFHYFWIKQNGVPKKTLDTALSNTDFLEKEKSVHL